MKEKYIEDSVPKGTNSYELQFSQAYDDYQLDTDDFPMILENIIRIIQLKKMRRPHIIA